MTMDIQISLPLDRDGFLRRECPGCEREFKWHHGATDEAPTDFVYPDVYHCPLCGDSAATNAWWTTAQIEYQRQHVASAARADIRETLRQASKPSRGSFISYKVNESSAPGLPDPLVEPRDMIVLAPPCHPWEPVKVPEDATAPFYCLICGQTFAA